MAKAGCTHTAVNVSKPGERAEKMLCFRWVNTALGNLKTAISGTLKSVRGHYVFRYFAEFQYRFNRRIDLKSLVGRLGHACARAKPRPYAMIRVVDVDG